MSKEKQIGSNVPIEASIISLDAVQNSPISKESASDLSGPQLINTTWSATYKGNGVIKLNINCPIIHAGSTVLVGISEYSNTGNPAGSRFVGSARFGVFNIAPREGGVTVWMEIGWNQPLNIYIELAVN